MRPADVRPLERFAVRSSAGLVGVLAAGIGFVLLWALVQSTFTPLYELDRSVTDALNAAVAGQGLLVRLLHGLTDFGGREILTRVLVLAVTFLLIRRQPRLAAFVAVSSIGALILDPTLKLLIGRLRPVVEEPVAVAPGMSFPSGHALGSFVAYGALALVFLPTVPRRWRTLVVAVAAALVVVVGFTRVALGVHHLSDVVAGWLLGALWLGVTGVAFRLWRLETGAPPTPLTEGLAPEAEPALHGASRAHEHAEHPWLAAAVLAVGWVLVFGALFGVGLLQRAVLPADSPVLAADRAVVGWLAAHRTDALDTLTRFGSSLGNTHWILAGTLAAVIVALATLGRWRPVLFLTVVMMGEVTLYVASSRVVTQDRPDVVHLGPQLPANASFPSGHVAAAMCLYGAIAVLVWQSTGNRAWRSLALAVAVVVPAYVAFARLYRGVHFPTDILGSLLLALPWVALCWRVICPLAPAEPVRRAAPDEERHTSPTVG